jgi:hypothetical protein
LTLPLIGVIRNVIVTVTETGFAQGVKVYYFKIFKIIQFNFEIIKYLK